MKPVPPPPVPKPPVRTSTPSTPHAQNRDGTNNQQQSSPNSNEASINNHSNNNQVVSVTTANLSQGQENQNNKFGSSFRSRQQLAVASTPKSKLHDSELYERIKQELPDCAAVDSIKFEHRSRGVNITDEDENNNVSEKPSSKRSTEPTLDEELARIHRNAQEYQQRILNEANKNDKSGAKNFTSEGDEIIATKAKSDADAEISLRLRDLEEAMARVDEHFSVVDSVEKEYFEAESTRFAKEKAELAARTQKRLEHARAMVRLADDTAAKREKDNKFLDRETALAELVFLECVQRQSLRKEEETKRLVAVREALENKHYLLGLQDLRAVVKSAWVEGVSKTENWKNWADGLSQELGLPKVTGEIKH